MKLSRSIDLYHLLPSVGIGQAWSALRVSKCGQLVWRVCCAQPPPISSSMRPATATRFKIDSEITPFLVDLFSQVPSQCVVCDARHCPARAGNSERYCFVQKWCSWCWWILLCFRSGNAIPARSRRFTCTWACIHARQMRICADCRCQHASQFWWRVQTRNAIKTLRRITPCAVDLFRMPAMPAFQRTHQSPP